MSVLTQVENFKSVRRAKILIKGLTVLTGESNEGKSSYLKALYAATHNRFKGNSVRWDEDFALIKIKPEEENRVLTVKRKAQGGSPIVTLGSLPPWCKLNRDMPKEVQDYLNLGQVQVTPTEKYSLSFFTQFQPPLLVGFSPRRVMDILSTSKSTEELAELKKELESKRERAKGSVSSLSSIVEETKQAVHLCDRKLVHLPKVEQLKKLRDRLLKDAEEEKLLVQLKTKLDLQEIHEMQLAALKMIISYKDKLVQAESTMQGLVSLIANLRELKKIRKASISMKSLISIKESLVKEQAISQKYTQLLTGIKLIEDTRKKQVLLGSLVDLKSLLDKKAMKLVKYNTLLRSKEEQDRSIESIVLVESILKIRINQQQLKASLDDSLRKRESLNRLRGLVELRTQLLLVISRNNKAIESGVCEFCGKPLDQHV